MNRGDLFQQMNQSIFGMKYDLVCSYSIQGVITETTRVWSSLSGNVWNMIKDIEELHAFLSFSQSAGNVGNSLLDLMGQGNSGVSMTGGDYKSRILQDQGRDWLVGQLDNKQ